MIEITLFLVLLWGICIIDDKVSERLCNRYKFAKKREQGTKFGIWKSGLIGLVFMASLVLLAAAHVTILTQCVTIIFMVLLLPVVFTDIKEQYSPFIISGPLILLSLGYFVARNFESFDLLAVAALVFSLAIPVVLFIMWYFNPKIIGLGDIALIGSIAPFIGAHGISFLMGWIMTVWVPPFVFFIGKSIKERKIDPDARVAFVPFLVGSIPLAMIAGGAVQQMLG